jgi:hypothetical protein
VIWVSCLINANVEGALNIFKCSNQACPPQKNLNETHIGTMRKQLQTIFLEIGNFLKYI